MSHNHERPNERQDVPLGGEVIGDADERRDRERDEQITQADERAGPGQVLSQLPAAMEPHERQQREDCCKEIHGCGGNAERFRNSRGKIRDQQAQTQGVEHLRGDPEPQPHVFRDKGVKSLVD